ncbi:hypothetical protein D1872_260830 [compost metagenome]
MTYPSAPVELIKISTSVSRFIASCIEQGVPLNLAASSCARPNVRFATITSSAPAPLRCLAVNSLILPAPRISTRFPVKLPKIRFPSSTAA